MKKVNYKSIRHSIELYYDYQRARIAYDHPFMHVHGRRRFHARA